MSANAHDLKSTPLKYVPKAASLKKHMQRENQGPKIAQNKEKVNLKKCKIDLGKFSKCRRVGKGEERYKGSGFTPDIKNLKEDEKENLKLVMVHNQDSAEIKMLANVRNKPELVTSENIDKVAEILEAEVRSTKKVKPTMVTDQEVAKILETGTRPKKDMAEIKMLNKVQLVMVPDEGVDKILEAKIRSTKKVKPALVTDQEVTNILETGTRPKKEIKMLTKVERKVQLVMVADEGVDKILEAEIRSKKWVKPTMVTDERVSKIADTEIRSRKRVKRPNKLASLKDALDQSSTNRLTASKTRVRPVMVTDEDVVEIKPAKMVLNLWVAEKEFNEKVKLVTVSDGEPEELKDIDMSNNASNIKRSEKDLKVPMIQMTKSVIEIQKLGKMTSLERRVKLTMVMDEKVPQVNDI